MSIARAFTTRRARRTLDGKDRESVNPLASDSTTSSSGFPRSVDSFLHRSKTTKSFRHKISGPVELTHTTNMLSYNAPDISRSDSTATASYKTDTRAAPEPMAAAPRSSSEVSDSVSDSGETNASTPPTSPDTPFPRDNDHKRSLSLEPNHLSCYFMPPAQVSQTNGLGIAAPAEDAAPAAPAPVIPARAPKHTARASEEILRHRSRSFKSDNSSRSLSSKGSFSFSRPSSISTTNTITSRASSMSRQPSTKLVISSPIAVSSSVPLVSTSTPPATLHKKEYSDAHPFGQELAQVSELVEELVKDEAPVEEEEEDAETLLIRSLLSEEEADMARQGLQKYSAESYICDVESMLSSFFAVEPVVRPVAVWI